MFKGLPFVPLHFLSMTIVSRLLPSIEKEVPGSVIWFLLFNNLNSFNSRLYPQSHALPLWIIPNSTSRLTIFLYFISFISTLKSPALITYKIQQKSPHNVTPNDSPLSFPISPLNTLFTHGCYGFLTLNPYLSSSSHNVFAIFHLLKPLQSSRHTSNVNLSP